MSSRPELKLDWCSHKAARYAIDHWHYSKSMPAGKSVKVGAWEDSKYIGVVIFGRGGNKGLGKEFGLPHLECCELVRVALSVHATPTSRILAISCKMLKRFSPGTRLIVSFSDMHQNHVGTLYQAAGWIYTGLGSMDSRCRPYRGKSGKIYHWRTVSGNLLKRGFPDTVDGAMEMGLEPLEMKPKHRYLMPLDKAMREQIAPLAKPYPKRAPEALPGDAPRHPAGTEGGSTPTSALQEK